MNEEKYLSHRLNNLCNKKILVTGANGALGFKICQNLAFLGANIVLCGRNINSLKEKVNLLKEKYPNNHFDILVYDQFSIRSIDNFVSDIVNKHADFDVIIFNAGVLKSENDLITEMGVPSVMGTNFVNLYYLILKLKPFLKDSIKERKIIFQGSLSSSISKYKSGDILLCKNKSYKAYNLSKCGVELLADKLAKENTNVKISYLISEPGICASNIVRNYPRLFRPFAKAGMRVLFNSTFKGSLTACHLVCDNYESGTILVPKHLFHSKGLPKIIKISSEITRNNMILDDAKNLISDYLFKTSL